MAPPSKKRVQSSAKKESSKKERSPRALAPIKNEGAETKEKSSKKKALASPHPPTRKLIDHRYMKQDSFFTKALKQQLEAVSSVAHTFAEPDSIDDAFFLPPEDTSKFRIMRQDYPAVPVLFRCPARPSSEWKNWVSSELENLAAKDQLRSAGILSALLSSTQLGIFRDILGLRHLVRRWNKTSHTFVCSWGEFTPTLEDVSKLLRLPVMGDALPFAIELSVEEAKIDAKLVDGLSLCRQLENNRQSSRPSYACWIRYFWGTVENDKFHPGAGYGKGCRLEALVCLWLCKFVFPELQGDIVQRRVFPLAIKLAHGVRFPLAPIFLGTLYKHLDMILEDEILAAGRYVIDTELSVNFLQVFMWERIKKYAGEPASDRSVMCELGLNSDVPLWSRWFHMKQTKACIWYFLDDIDNFTFRPYLELGNEFAANIHGNEATLASDSDILKLPMCDSDGNWADLEYVVSIRPGLLPAWIGTEVHTINYWPHRVLRQFGLDQGVPRPYPFLDEDVLSSPSFGVSRFISSFLKSIPAIESMMVQIACNKRQGLYTPRFLTYWEKTISEFDQFVRSPKCVCKALPPMLVPKRLRVDTREVRSFSTKTGMPFTVIDGTHREVVGESRKSQKVDDLEENLPLIEAFPRNPTVVENDPSLDQRTPRNTPSKKRALPKPKSASPKRKSARLLKKSLPEDTVAKEIAGKVTHESRFEETGHASAGLNGDALNELQPVEDRREPISEEGNKNLKSGDDNTLESEIALAPTHDNQPKRDLPLAMVSRGNHSPDQSRTPSPLAAVPRGSKFPSQTLSPSSKRRRKKNPAEDRGSKGVKRQGREARTPLLGVNGEAVSGTSAPTALENSAADSFLKSKLNEFLGSFYGNSVAPHSVEEFLKLGGHKKILNGITIPEESFDSMSDAIEKHGDFAANCWASKPVRDIMFSRLSLVFYTLTKTPLSKLSEDLLLALRDVVREAVAVGFGVDFLLDHLRKLVSALFGRQIYFDKLTALDSQIENIEKEIVLARAKLEELKNSRSNIVSQASVSTGTEGDCIRQALDFCTTLVHGL